VRIQVSEDDLGVRAGRDTPAFLEVAVLECTGGRAASHSCGGGGKGGRLLRALPKYAVKIITAYRLLCWSRAGGAHSSDPRAGTPLLGGKAGRAGAAQPGEEKAAGRAQSS